MHYLILLLISQYVSQLIHYPILAPMRKPILDGFNGTNISQRNATNCDTGALPMQYNHHTNSTTNNIFNNNNTCWCILGRLDLLCIFIYGDFHRIFVRNCCFLQYKFNFSTNSHAFHEIQCELTKPQYLIYAHRNYKVYFTLSEEDCVVREKN